MAYAYHLPYPILFIRRIRGSRVPIAVPSKQPPGSRLGIPVIGLPAPVRQAQLSGIRSRDAQACRLTPLDEPTVEASCFHDQAARRAPPEKTPQRFLVILRSLPSQANLLAPFSLVIEYANLDEGCLSIDPDQVLRRCPDFPPSLTNILGTQQA